MFQPAQAKTNGMTLAEVIDRLAQNKIVTGLLVIGSASKDKLTPSSDYDLVIVLAENHLPLHVGVTYIDGRFTDLIFLTTAQFEQILALETAIDEDEWLGRIIRWVQEGTIAFDRRGHLAQAQEKVTQGQWLQVKDKVDGYNPWFRVNYNLSQNKRMLTSNDPVYQTVVDLRVALYGSADLFFSYFAIRNLPWSGEKDAVRYLLAHDPAYLDLFQKFISEGDRERKFEIYEELAELTVAPAGSIWQDDVSVMTFERKVGLSVIAEAVDFWDELVGGIEQS